jgi:hypothetical protein
MAVSEGVLIADRSTGSSLPVAMVANDGQQRIATFGAEDAPGVITKVATRRLG